jgi:hypothetical protein
MKANEIVERFKNVLLSTETKEEETPVVEDQVELSEEAKDIQVDAAEEVKETEEVEMTEELEETEEVMEEEDKMDMYVTKEDLAKAMAEVKGMIEELTAQKEEELEVPTELSNQEPAVEPLSHSPEAEVSKKPTHLFAQNRSKSTLDRVMSKITNN